MTPEAQVVVEYKLNVIVKRDGRPDWFALTNSQREAKAIADALTRLLACRIGTVRVCAVSDINTLLTLLGFSESSS